MRILHTADWHLGKMFYGEYVTEDQSCILSEQLLPMVRDEGIDAVVLAGDVYDRSLPPSEAVELFDEIATKLTCDLKVPLLVISGNHDSAVRLSFASRLLRQQQLFIAGELTKLTGPIVLEDAFGPVAFVPVPFAEPAVVRHFLGNEEIKDHQTALECLCRVQSQNLPEGMRTVCIAHAFVTGGSISDSERPLSVGGSSCVDASIFKPFSYTALGHLHGPQQAGRPEVRYAGSLMKYSFSEAQQQKGAVLVDLQEDGQVAVNLLPFIPKHDVRIIEGSFDTIMKATDDHEDDFVLIRLSDAEPILDGMAKVRRKYPRALALETPNRQYEGRNERDFDVRNTTERQLFASFTEAMRPEHPLSEAETACANGLWEQLIKDEGEGLL
ncbi:exonuclease SbcCD subunit D [Megasphaera paucivorans]|uniref:Nuclease SbcCD subunit D n=1 Tax=Megasphaera paucivorans TaxID=349095 RepID=A0A1G9UQY8_9FIRM|nr:exonuclease SbcCD subunit D [Megasphaera paucivorans]SDM62310.1 Exodeoxyribonuclease I subunit D [Megasphaera paucivorans]